MGGGAHYNTEHPHVHTTLRGIGADGRPFRLSRDYIRQGIRCAAEDLCTRQLGYRTEFDTAAAQRREVQAHRYTSLDGHSSAMQCGQRVGTGILHGRAAPESGLGQSQCAAMHQHTMERLVVLEGMAWPSGSTHVFGGCVVTSKMSSGPCSAALTAKRCWRRMEC